MYPLPLASLAYWNWEQNKKIKNVYFKYEFPKNFIVLSSWKLILGLV